MMHMEQSGGAIAPPQLVMTASLAAGKLGVKSTATDDPVHEGIQYIS